MKPEYKTGNYIIRIKFSNADDSSSYHLDYRLYDHSLVNKWMKLMILTLEQDHGKVIREGIFAGNGVNDKQDLIRKLDATVDFHNEYCREQGFIDCIIPVKTDNPPTQGRLSHLHEFFEKYAEDLRFSKDPKSRANLQDMNLHIHGIESCLDEHSKACHIEILANYYLKVPFEVEDYNFFDLDSTWGQLVLTYGITGVPTVNAFWSNSEPRPQSFLTNGMTLSFWGDITFDKHKELEAWLKTKGLDINDPKSALGYVGLGILDNLDTCDRDTILRDIAKHTRVVGYEFFREGERSNIPAKPSLEVKKEPIRERVIVPSQNVSRAAAWPYDQEIFYHLDLVPYIDLKVSFDSKKLFEEAFKARDYFVVHRDYDQNSGETFGKWKSLGLRSLFGDYTKTQYHTSYTFEGKAEYKNTVFSELCPETMKFLDTITDISQCERVRFMLLEPGASINVHRDSKERDVSLAVNISLNMPNECEFFAQLNADGTLNEHTVKLPFKDSGSVLLFNNAKYHSVVNNSNTPRIHIIFHGPVRFADETILKLARTQNNINERKELLKKLIQKKAALGEELNKTPTLFSDWLSSGLNHDTLPKDYVLAVYDHDVYFEGENSTKHLEKRTAPTLFPLAYSIIKENTWDLFLQKSCDEGREFAVVFAAGTFVLDISRFLQELIINCQELKKRNWPAAGHLMDFNNKHLPYFHEQFIIINLKAWKEIGSPALGPLFGMDSGELKDADISSDHIHDDYTPLFIESSKTKSGKVVRKGLYGWGSHLIECAINNGRGVLNISTSIRELKTYGYPRDEIKENRNKIESIVQAKLKMAKNEVFCFNNEILSILKVPQLQPSKLISVAAGFKPFHILKQFNFANDAKIHFADFSPSALRYIKSLTQQDSVAGIENTIGNEVKLGTTRSLAPGVGESLLHATIRDYFEGDQNELLRFLNMAQNATFDEVNLILEHDKITNLLSEGDRFVIWTSNAFYNNQLYLILTPQEANQKLEELARAIGIKTSLRVFRLRNSYTFAFGKGLDFIRGILTDGAAQEAQFVKEFWDEIR